MASDKLLRISDDGTEEEYELEISDKSLNEELAVLDKLGADLSEPEIKPDEKLIATAKRLRVTRFVLLLVIVCISLFGVMKFSSIINAANLKEIFYSFRDIDALISDDGVSVSSADLAACGSYKSYVAALRSDRIELYRADGTRFSSKHINMTAPKLVTSEKYMLIYDLGGTSVQLYNTVDLVYEKDFDNSVYTADINKNGIYAILTHDVSSASELIVYEKDFSEIFRWTSADKYTTSVKMLDDNDHIAVASFNSDAGEPTVYLNIFSINTGKAKSYTYKDTLPMKVGKTDSGCYLVCSDRIVFFDKNGNELCVNEFMEYGDIIADIADCPNAVAVSLTETETTDLSTILVYNSAGKRIYSGREDYEVSAIACDGNNVFYIVEDSLATVNTADGGVKKVLLSGDYSDIITYKNGKLLLVSGTDIRISK